MGGGTDDDHDGGHRDGAVCVQERPGLPIKQTARLSGRSIAHSPINSWPACCYQLHLRTMIGRGGGGGRGDSYRPGGNTGQPFWSPASRRKIVQVLLAELILPLVSRWLDFFGLPICVCAGGDEPKEVSQDTHT